jgi:hypothetical protein
MTGPTGWIVFVPIVLGFIGIILLIWDGVRAERGFYVEERAFHCPKFDRDVVATLVRLNPRGKVLGVRRCTGLSDPDLVTCGKECIAGLQQAAANDPDRK